MLYLVSIVFNLVYLQSRFSNGICNSPVPPFKLAFNWKIHHQAPYEQEGGISNKWLLLISEMHLKVFNGKMPLGI